MNCTCRRPPPQLTLGCTARPGQRSTRTQQLTSLEALWSPRSCHLMYRVGAGGYPPNAPLRTVHETFASHSSSLSKARLVRGDPLLRGKRCILRTHRIPLAQLGNTGWWPLALCSIGQQLRDAPSDGRRSSFAFPELSGSTYSLAIRHLADVGISGALPPALASSAFSMLRFLPCLAVG